MDWEHVASQDWLDSSACVVLLHISQSIGASDGCGCRAVSTSWPEESQLSSCLRLSSAAHALQLLGYRLVGRLDCLRCEMLTSHHAFRSVEWASRLWPRFLRRSWSGHATCQTPSCWSRNALRSSLCTASQASMVPWYFSPASLDVLRS